MVVTINLVARCGGTWRRIDDQVNGLLCTTTTYTRYIDTPANGLLFSKSTDLQGVTMGSSSGWAVAMLKGSGTEFDGWAAYIRGKR